MKEILSEKGKVITTVSSHRWDNDEQWRTRLTEHARLSGHGKITIREVK